MTYLQRVLKYNISCVLLTSFTSFCSWEYLDPCQFVQNIKQVQFGLSSLQINLTITLVSPASISSLAYTCSRLQCRKTMNCFDMEVGPGWGEQLSRGGVHESVFWGSLSGLGDSDEDHCNPDVEQLQNDVIAETEGSHLLDHFLHLSVSTPLGCLSHTLRVRPLQYDSVTALGRVGTTGLDG